MRDFEVDGIQPERFVEVARQVLVRRGYDDIVDLDLEQEGTLRVRFSKMGVTELVYLVSERSAGFTARLQRQRVATFHAPFVSVFQAQFEQVIQEAGGRLIS
jgi:hypothetical protein